MTYVDAFTSLIGQFSNFLQANQALLISVLFVGAYFAKRLVDYKAANPAQNIWDDIKPGSDALYSLVHRGVEYLAKSKGLDAAAKLLVYQERLEQFEKLWNSNKRKAIEELAAWFLSMKAKDIAANPSTALLTADTPAAE